MEFSISFHSIRMTYPLSYDNGYVITNRENLVSRNSTLLKKKENKLPNSPPSLSNTPLEADNMIWTQTQNSPKMSRTRRM